MIEAIGTGALGKGTVDDKPSVGSMGQGGGQPEAETARLAVSPRRVGDGP